MEALLAGVLAGLIVLVALYVLDTAQARGNAMLNEAHRRFEGERAQWLQERQLLLNRVVDPPAGIAQSLAIGQTAFDPSEAHDWAGYAPPESQEMPDFPVQGERTLT